MNHMQAGDCSAWSALYSIYNNLEHINFIIPKLHENTCDHLLIQNCTEIHVITYKYYATFDDVSTLDHA